MGIIGLNLSGTQTDGAVPGFPNGSSFLLNATGLEGLVDTDPVPGIGKFEGVSLSGSLNGVSFNGQNAEIIVNQNSGNLVVNTTPENPLQSTPPISGSSFSIIVQNRDVILANPGDLGQSLTAIFSHFNDPGTLKFFQFNPEQINPQFPPLGTLNTYQLVEAPPPSPVPESGTAGLVLGGALAVSLLTARGRGILKQAFAGLRQQIWPATSKQSVPEIAGP